MKNLAVIGKRENTVLMDRDSSIVGMCKTTDMLESSEGSAVVLSQDGVVRRISPFGETLWESNLEEAAPGGRWFDISYIDPEIVCLSKNGGMVTISPEDGKVELVGVFDLGLEAGCWSPDKEVLLLVTSIASEHSDDEISSVLMTMNSQWEVLAEVSIDDFVPSRDANNAQISVAWRPDGTLCALNAIDAASNTRMVRIYKRETLELHAVGRMEDASGRIVPNMCQTPVAWAGPGCSQLLSAVQRKGKKTIQVVFFESNGLRHREIVLRDPGENREVLKLTWSVESDLLAVAIREIDTGVDKVQLWHRSNYHWYMKQEFRYDSQDILDISFDNELTKVLRVFFDDSKWVDYEFKWDPSTTILSEEGCSAFVVDGPVLSMTPFEKAMVPPPMYFSSFKFPFPVNEVVTISGNEIPFAVLVVLSDGSYFLVDKSSVPHGFSGSTEPTAVAWKDDRSRGNPYRGFCCIGGDCDRASFLAVAAHNQLVLVDIHRASDASTWTAAIVDTIETDDSVLTISNWADTHTGALVELVDGTILEAEAKGGRVSLFHSSVGNLLEPCPWLSGIKKASSLTNDVDCDENQDRLVFGLSSKLRLYSGDFLLSESASSFYVSCSHGFLCYATAGSRCVLRFLPLMEMLSFDPLMGSDQNLFLQGYEPRNAERGSTIVGILPAQPTVVLQMPRGNLEGIYPRALVVRSVLNQIMTNQYGKAFVMMRRQKLDLNLVVDIDPKHFVESGIASFLEQVTNVDHLNLFISSLHDWDTTLHRFPIPQWMKKSSIESSESFDFSSKVNQVCKAAREIMIRWESSGASDMGRVLGDGYYLLPILSTFAKESPPQLEEALSLIRENAQKNPPSNSKKPPLFAERAQSSIHFLAFLAEYELLFDTAIGMYDFELARAVARNSQMDPKKYLPLLRRLRALPEFYAKFEADQRLKRRESALVHLVQSMNNNEVLPADESAKEFDQLPNNFATCLTLVKDHGLHKRGLALFQGQKDRYNEIFCDLGRSLLESKKPNVALSVFLSLEPVDIKNAIRAARASGDWRTLFSLHDEYIVPADRSLSISEEIIREKRIQLAREIADEILTGMRGPRRTRSEKHEEAARVLLDYASDIHGAIEALLGGQLWFEAKRIATRQENDTLVQRCVEDAVLFAHMSIDDLRARVKQFTAATKRYSQSLWLRKKAVADEIPDNDQDDHGSLFSAATNQSNLSLRSSSSTSSTGSVSSISSVISVKSTTTFTMTGDEEVNKHRSKFNKGKKKKAAKKKKSGKNKPGSQQELDSIVAELVGACVDAELATSISRTIEFLQRSKRFDAAESLFHCYVQCREEVEKAQAERIELAAQERFQAERDTRELGDQHEHFFLSSQLEVETKVDSLGFPSLAESVNDFFGMIS